MHFITTTKGGVEHGNSWAQEQNQGSTYACYKSIFLASKDMSMFQGGRILSLILKTIFVKYMTKRSSFEFMMDRSQANGIGSGQLSITVKNDHKMLDTSNDLSLILKTMVMLAS